MKRILNQSKAYQSLVDQFEDKRRKQRNIITKQEDQIRDQESELIKQKNVLLDNGEIIIEHSSNFSLAEKNNNIEERKYGSSILSFIKKASL